MCPTPWLSVTQAAVGDPKPLCFSLVPACVAVRATSTLPEESLRQSLAISTLLGHREVQAPMSCSGDSLGQIPLATATQAPSPEESWQKQVPLGVLGQSEGVPRPQELHNSAREVASCGRLLKGSMPRQAEGMPVCGADCLSMGVVVAGSRACRRYKSLGLRQDCGPHCVSRITFTGGLLHPH